MIKIKNKVLFCRKKLFIFDKHYGTIISILEGCIIMQKLLKKRFCGYENESENNYFNCNTFNCCDPVRTLGGAYCLRI